MSDFVPQPFTQALSEFAWVTPRELKALQAASYTTVGDVLLRVPRRYEDRRCTKPINALKPHSAEAKEARKFLTRED